MTDSAYTPLTNAEQIFYDLVWSPMIAAGEKALETEVPFFAAPVISTLEEGIINDASKWVYQQVVLFIDIEMIKLVNAAHQTAYDSASLQLKVIAIDDGITSPQYATARTAAMLALSQFTRFGAAGAPASTGVVTLSGKVLNFTKLRQSIRDRVKQVYEHGFNAGHLAQPQGSSC